MRHKKWLVISLLIGTVLLMSIAGANVLYTDAVLQRMLTKDLEAELIQNNNYPFFIRMQDSYSPDGRQASKERMDAIAERAGGLSEELELPLEEQVRIYQSRVLEMHPELVREDSDPISLQLTDMSNLEEKIELISGSAYTPLSAGMIDVIVPENTLIKHDLILGETLFVSPQRYITDEFFMQNDLPEEGMKIRIAGVFRAKDLSDAYWYRTPSFYSDSLFVHPEFMAANYIENPEPISQFTGIIYTMPDYTALRVHQVPITVERLHSLFQFMGSNNLNYHENVTSNLSGYMVDKQQTQMTLALLQIPIYLLLLAFILMVSGQLINMETNEIAVFKSRGSSRTQIIRIYLLQGILIALFSTILAVPGSFFITQMLGSSSEFLRFVQREALPIMPGAVYWAVIAAAAVLSLLVMIIPAFRVSRVSIVEAKQRKKERKKLPFWQLAGLDVILLAVALYALYSFDRQKETLRFQVAQGESLDALLFLASSVFLLGAALLAWRIIPWLIKGVYRIVRGIVGPSVYASFLQIIRSGNRQGFISVFLMLTVAMGIFNAVAARSINSNGERDIFYRNGADLAVQEMWDSNAESVAQDPELELVFQEPDYSAFGEIPAIESYSRVYRNEDFSIRKDGVSLNGVRMMGIHTKEFGETATPLDGLLPSHINNYLNRMALDPRAILVSENFRNVLDLEEGDILNYYSDDGSLSSGVIAGFVPYYPGFQPRTIEIGDDGLPATTDNYLIVAHLAELQQNLGLRPYELWFRTNDSNAFIYEFSEETGRRFTRFRDSHADLVEMRNDPGFQGTNGILTVSFVVVLLLSATGFLIYWILSIRERTLTFGIQRAMGLSMGQILIQLINEQLFVTVPALLAGGLIGVLAARLYVPLIQTAYAAADQTVPFRIEAAGSDILRMAIIIIGVMLVCIAVLAVMIRRMKITQALKLGED